jgi:hypothetical protein
MAESERVSCADLPQQTRARTTWSDAIMAITKSKAELEAENADLRDENQELQDPLEAITYIVAPEDEDEDDDENGDDEEEDEDDDQD